VLDDGTGNPNSYAKTSIGIENNDGTAGVRVSFDDPSFPQSNSAVHDRARSRRRSALPLTHFIPDSLTYSVHPVLNRECGWTPGRDPAVVCGWGPQGDRRARPRALTSF
jgi:hypothetical protein